MSKLKSSDAIKSVEASGRDIFQTYLVIGVPAIVGLMLYPFIIANLGIVKFGIFSSLIAFSMFLATMDLGSSIAINREIAKLSGKMALTDIRMHIVAAILVVATITFLLIIGVLVVSLIIPNSFLAIGLSENSNEYKNALKIILITVPFHIATSIFRGAYDGLGNYYRSNILKLCIVFCSVILPVIFTFFTDSLVKIFLGVFFARITVFIIFSLDFKLASSFFRFIKINSERVIVVGYIRTLTKFGIWTFVASLAGGAMITGIIDRFFVIQILDVDQLYYIAISFDLINRLSLLPAALSVMVLGFLSIKNTYNFGNVKSNIKNCINIYGMQMLPIVCIGILNLEAILGFIVGQEEVDISKLCVILTPMLVGIYFNSIAQILAMLLYERGDPHIAASRHLIQIPLYALVSFGIVSAGRIDLIGYAWCCLVIIDYFFLIAICHFRYQLKNFLRDILISREFFIALPIILATIIVNVYKVNPFDLLLSFLFLASLVNSLFKIFLSKKPFSLLVDQ